MKDLMEDQQIIWKALREKYGPGDFPGDVYQQWDQQYGNMRLHGLRAQQHAELEAYPLNPREYRYQQEAQQPETAPAPVDTFEQLKQQQRQNAHDISAKQEPAENSNTLFDQLRHKQERSQEGSSHERWNLHATVIK